MRPMEEIYQEHAQTVFKYLMTLSHDAQLSEELTQETFYQAIGSIGRFNHNCKITTWLCAIAKNQFLAYQRKHPITEGLDMLEKIEVASPSAEQDAIAYADRINIMKKLHVCPEPYREILYLRLFGNLSYREIADVMGKTENWARVSFYRGKEHLRKEMEQDEE